MIRFKMKNPIRFLALTLSLLFVFPVSNSFFKTSADSIVSCDQNAKTITIKNSRFTMVYDYNNKSVISSLKMDNVELLGKNGIVSSSVLDADGSTISSSSLSESPKVSADSNSVVADFSMGNSRLSIDENWIFNITDNNIGLKVYRTYNWHDTSDTKISHNGMLEFNWERIWDNIRRQDDGGNIPLGNSYAGKNGIYLNTKGERTGLEQSNLIFLNSDNSQALKLNAASNRNTATEFNYEDDNQMCMDTELSTGEWNYTAGSKENGMVIGGHSSTDGTYIYSPVSIEQRQNDSISYNISAGNYNDYYAAGDIKGVSDTKALSSMLNDFGRSAIIDKGYGFSTVGIYQTGHGAYDSPYYLPLIQGLFDQKAVDAEKNQLIYDMDYAQAEDGHINGRTFHRDTKWGTDTLMDSDPAYAISISSIYNYSPDRTWLSKISGSCEKSLAYMINNHLNSNSLFNSGVDNTSKDGLFREWNDIFYIGNESSYINLLMYNALTQWSDIETNVIGNPTLGKSYANIAAALKKQFNKDTAHGGFWSNKTNSFVYWIDKDGSIHGDVVQAQIGMMAIEAGLTDIPRSKIIMSTIDSYMAKDKLQLIPENFIDYSKSEYPDFNGINTFKTGVENGAVYPLFVNDYMAASAKIGERDKSLSYLENVLTRYKKDGFNGFSHLDWNLNISDGFQEKWFPVNGNAASGLYRWMLGIQPTRTGVTIAPNIPSKMYGTSITKTIRGSQNLTVKYLSETSLNITWNASILPATVVWSGLNPGSAYYVKDNGINHKVIADGSGVVRYAYNNGSYHVVSISSKKP